MFDAFKRNTNSIPPSPIPLLDDDPFPIVMPEGVSRGVLCEDLADSPKRTSPSPPLSKPATHAPRGTGVGSRVLPPPPMRPPPGCKSKGGAPPFSPPPSSSDGFYNSRGIWIGAQERHYCSLHLKSRFGRTLVDDGKGGLVCKDTAPCFPHMGPPPQLYGDPSHGKDRLTRYCLDGLWSNNVDQDLPWYEIGLPLPNLQKDCFNDIGNDLDVLAFVKSFAKPHQFRDAISSCYELAWRQEGPHLRLFFSDGYIRDNGIRLSSDSCSYTPPPSSPPQPCSGACIANVAPCPPSIASVSQAHPNIQFCGSHILPGPSLEWLRPLMNQSNISNAPSSIGTPSSIPQYNVLQAPPPSRVAPPPAVAPLPFAGWSPCSPPVGPLPGPSGAGGGGPARASGPFPPSHQHTARIEGRYDGPTIECGTAPNALGCFFVPSHFNECIMIPPRVLACYSHSYGTLYAGETLSAMIVYTPQGLASAEGLRKL